MGTPHTPVEREKERCVLICRFLWKSAPNYGKINYYIGTFMEKTMLTDFTRRILDGLTAQNAAIAAPPTLWDVFSEITNHPEHRTQKQQIADIKLAAQTLTFIQTYNIDTLADMAAVQNLRARYNEMHNTLVSMSRRYHTLTEHIVQAESYVKYAPVYKRFMELKGEKEDAYFNKHREGILTFKAAHDYMTRHLNGRTKIPLDDWKHELAGLTAQREVLLSESDKLSAELRSAETIKRSAYPFILFKNSI